MPKSKKYKYDKYYDKIIEMKKNNKSNKEILQSINDPDFTLNKLYKISYRLNVSKKKYNEKYREIDEKAIELINSGISHRETARMLNIDQQSMSLRLRTYFNICPLPDGKKYVNSNYFKTIDTEEKAYWLGLLYADGYVNEESGIELTLKDKDHVEKFKKAIDSTHNIQEKNTILNNKTFTNYRISIKDKQISKDLIRLGCFQNKSLILKFPTEEQLPNHLIRHFIRGYVDGDGTISISNSKSPQAVLSIVGTRCFINSYVLFLEKELDIKFGSYLGINGKAFSKTVCGNIKAKKVIDYLYSDINIYLDRKYEKYKEICRLR